MEKKKSNKWSIQISKSLAEHLKDFCKKNGYSISGFVEISVLQKISGSYGK